MSSPPPVPPRSPPRGPPPSIPQGIPPSPPRVTPSNHPWGTKLPSAVVEPPNLASETPEVDLRCRIGGDSDDSSENSVDCTPTNSDSVMASSRSPRPSKYNFYVELDPDMDGSQRIALLQHKLQELRKTYINVKAELACIDRRRKKLRRREREGYIALRNSETLTLPHHRYLDSFKMKLGPGTSGISKQQGSYLKKKKDILESSELFVNILVDEVYVRPDVTYKGGKIEGMVIKGGDPQNDNIESRFGQYRQMSGGNYHISVTEILESERKIKAISLLKIQSYKAGEFSIKDLSLEEDEERDDKELTESGVLADCPNVYDEVKNLETSQNELMTLIYIAGYAVHKIEKLKNCTSCKNVMRSSTLRLQNTDLDKERKGEAQNILNKVDEKALGARLCQTITGRNTRWWGELRNDMKELGDGTGQDRMGSAHDHDRCFGKTCQ
uniref:Uncharacterized protein n=1 Tax=Timema tahoe TaxID=61484 RepID=A0A7R9NYR1_9NEOP|nr:unnamed protein product [Timema tahoe]